MSFVLRYSVPAPVIPEYPLPVTYDPELQMNVLPDGQPACLNETWVRISGTTTSTAGSKTHFDD